MIERHYFKNTLVKSFDFNFGFCIPGSTNTWEAVYDIPTLDDALIQDMILNPFGTQSDSFYFVGDQLIMHNKASYRYVTDGNGLQNSFRNAEPKEIVNDMMTSCKPMAKSMMKSLDTAQGVYSVDDHLSEAFCEAKITSMDDDTFDSFSESKDGPRTKAHDTQYESKYDM